MPTLDIADRIDRLRRWSLAYYNSGAPDVSDVEFDAERDAVVAHLREHDPGHAYLAEVGSTIVVDLPKVAHIIPMGSQNKATTPEAFLDWWRGLSPVAKAIILTWKMDGSSVAITYRKGKATLAVTRGDGVQGNDITRNMKRWVGVPKTIPVTDHDVVVRGEAQLFASDWKAHLPGTSNPRNVGNGIIMRKDDPEDLNRLIRFTAFDAVGLPAWDAATTQTTAIAALRAAGFTPIAGHAVRLTTEAQIRAAYDAMLAAREGLDHEVDGLVAYVDDRAAQRAMGASDGGTRPNGQIAWKFPPETKESIVIDVIGEIGKTGSFSPVAVIEPLRLGGTTVDRVALTSIGRVEDLGLAVGDRVAVCRANDVIPYLVRVTRKARAGTVWHPPVTCPSCGTALARDGAHIRCPNTGGCPAQQIGRIGGYIAKLEILGVGDGLLAAMAGAGMLRGGIGSIYGLTAAAIADLPVGNGRFGDDRAAGVVAAVRKTVGVLPLATWIGSCGIMHLGRRQAEKIIQAMVTATGRSVALADILALGADGLAALPDAGMGPVKSREIAADLEASRAWLTALAAVVRPIAAEPLAAGTATGGFAICLTGTMSRSRKDIAADIVKAGHRVLDDVADGCTHLVQADPASQSSKSKKAAKKGIPVIGERDLAKLLAGGS